MDSKIERNYPLKFIRTSPPYRVFATWNIHYGCNYKCTYCHAPKPGNPGVRDARYISVMEWVKIWEELYDRYGTWEIHISGGEPFTYPNFMQILIELSKIHFLSVVTNLSFDVEYFVKSLTPDRVQIESSFHPEFVDIDTFVRKLKILKENGFEPTVNFVPWPPFLKMMKEVKEKVESIGCILSLQPFIGVYEGREYPRGYTDEELKYFEIFDSDMANRMIIDFKTEGKAETTKGKLCRMGQNYCFIHPDGEASRCCRDHTISLGNLIDRTFKFLEEPVPCNADSCNCWRWMQVGNEDFWLKHWGRREISKKAIELGKSRTK